jgi:hypothetical protein
MLSLNSKSSTLLFDGPEEPDAEAKVETPFPTNFPRPPRMLGRNIAINTDFTICAPMKIGNRSFFSPKARNPSPKPVRNELFPPSSETGPQILKQPIMVPQKSKLHIKTVPKRMGSTQV